MPTTALGRGELVLLGPPGVGKGTQARLLADRHGWVQVATGDLFRDHAERGSELGRLALGYMAEGSYVPDDVTVGMVRERVAAIPTGTRVVFDGFPRTVAQASALDGLLAALGRRLGTVVLFELPREELLARLAGRATCGRCQAVYSAASWPPAAPGICDRCGGAVSATARPDESPDVVRRRLTVYEEQTGPVIAHYQRRGLLRRIDASGPIDDIAKQLSAVAAG